MTPFNSFKVHAISIAALALLLAAGQSAYAGDYNWRITRDRWSPADEHEYADFIAALGGSGCNTIDKCLKNPANPFRASDPVDISFQSDCADLPYVLRAYFSWKKGLPFSYASSMDSIGGGGDIRYSPNGNKVGKRTDITVTSPGTFVNALKAITSMRDDVSTAMYRLPPDGESDKLFQDFYPLALNRDAIKPGTMVYDPNGHVALIYRVETDGRILMFDAHPDNSISHITYGAKFVRSRPAAGAGFKAFRPIRLVGAKSVDGILIGGTYQATKNSDLKDYSKEQFYGNHPDPSGSWQKGSFVYKGETLDYYDYLRRSVALGDLKYHPVEELNNMLDALCSDLQDRVTAAQLAIFTGMDKKVHPSNLPMNIYGTDGEWETYASPSRDARLKASFKEAHDRTEQFVELHKSGDPSVEYHGNDLKGDLLQAYNTKATGCVIEYTRSNGSKQSLTLEQVSERLYKLSFDPYHCIEHRWGATEASELSGCTDNQDKSRWYDGEQGLRNQIERAYDAKMGFSREELFTAPGANKFPTGADVDIRAYLTKL